MAQQDNNEWSMKRKAEGIGVVVIAFLVAGGFITVVDTFFPMSNTIQTIGIAVIGSALAGIFKYYLNKRYAHHES